MTPQKKHRLVFLMYSSLSLSLGVVILLFVLKDNLMYFYVPSDLAPLTSFYGQRIRLGGMVKEGSIKQDLSTLKTCFIICDGHSEIKVDYTGVLPDLFREGQGVVAEGKLGSANVFFAHQVLAKHDENYMPPEVAKSLNKSHRKLAVQSLASSPLSKGFQDVGERRTSTSE